MTTDTRIDPATTEARCRRLMAERAYLPDAYPHRDKRADLWALIHAELDAWLEANVVVTLTVRMLGWCFHVELCTDTDEAGVEADHDVASTILDIEPTGDVAMGFVPLSVERE